MNKPKIIFFDIDDTLYRKYTDTIRPSVYQAVAALRQNGILTAIATGRTYAAIPEKVRALAENGDMDLLLTINGQLTRYRGEVIDKRALNRTVVENLCREMERQNIAYAFVADHTIAVSDFTPVTAAALQPIFPQPIIDKEFFKSNEVFQMLAFYSKEREREMADIAARYGCKTVRWHEQAVDIIDIEGSKARGIGKAVQQLGIDMRDVMAFGDGLNDIEMIKTVGFGVAMENGHPSLKAAADYICPTVEEDGIYRGLQALGIIR